MFDLRYLCNRNKKDYIMKKYFHILALAILTVGSLTLTSCDIEFDNTSVTSNEYNTKLANTRWQLTEVFNSNNVWVKPELCPSFNITDLRFGGKDTYEMVVRNLHGNQGLTTYRGHFTVNGKNISFTAEPVDGISFFLNINSLDGQRLEGVLTLMGDIQSLYAPNGNAVTYHRDTKSYVIRLQRK